MTNYQTKQLDPAAWISINGGRKKIYEDKFVYLSDNQQFEIELFNPSNKTYLAKIKLNDEYISSSGLVLRPGERHVLKRFLDKDKAFLFKTYEIEADNSDVKQAISNNGKVKVEFYQKVEPVQISHIYYPYYTYYKTSPYFSDVIYGNTSNNITYNLNSTFTSNTSDLNLDLNNVKSMYTEDNFQSLHNVENSKKEETGTVEAGEKTGQSFGTVDMDFNSYSSYTTEYQILPVSKQPILKEDIKIYCTNCGKKCKNEHNFCPKCGTKINKN